MVGTTDILGARQVANLPNHSQALRLILMTVSLAYTTQFFNYFSNILS